MTEHQDTALIVDDFKAGRVDRRSAVRRFFAMGIGAPAAYAALGEIAAQAAETPSGPLVYPSGSNDALTQNFTALSRLVSSPEMQAAMDLAEKEPDRQKAAKILTDAAYSPGLRQKVGLTDDQLRTSMRVFERDPATGAEKAIATTRRVGAEGLTKYAKGKTQPVISDDEVQKFYDQIKNGGKPVNNLNNPKPSLPSASNVVARAGICVSYGKDLCVSGGVP